MDTAEADVRAVVTCPREHRAKTHSTNFLEWANGRIKRGTDVVSIFPNNAVVIRLASPILLEQNGERAERVKVPTAKQLESQWRASSAATRALRRSRRSAMVSLTACQP